MLVYSKMRTAKSRPWVALLLALSFTFASVQPAQAAPDPVIASLLSTGSTLIPVAIGTGLLTTGRGADEGLRFDMALGTIALGSIAGPTVGMLYGEAGIDALVTFLLRLLTGGIMVAGLGLRLRGGENVRGLGLALLVVGAIPTGLLAIYDIFAAASAATEARRASGIGGSSASLLAPELLSIARCGPVPCSTAQ